MQRKFLEDLGIKDKETIDKIIDENSSDIGKAKGELETVQGQLKDANTEIETLKGQVSERDGQLETLKKSTGDVDELKKQIETLQSENKTNAEAHAKEIQTIKREQIDKELLKNANAKNVDIVLNSLEKIEDDKMDLETYKIKRQTEIEGLVKGNDTKFLFDSKKETKFKGAEPGKGDTDDADDDKVDLSKMTYDERNEYLNEHPEIEV